MNIYVANLSFRIQDENLREIFEDYGTVSSAKVVKDRETGKSRGFGFVEMPDDTQAKSAIEQLNDAEWDGKILKITEARPKAEGENQYKSRGPRNFNRNSNHR